jgi:peroxiredoxin
MVQAGQPAPGFELTALDGERRSLGEMLPAGPVLVSFFKVSCPVCQLTLPFLDRMKGGPIQIVAVSQDPETQTESFNQRFGSNLLTVLDRGEEGYPVSNAYGITHVPTLFLVEQDGRVSQVIEGFVKADLEALGQRIGIPPFRQEDNVPAWKAG